MALVHLLLKVGLLYRLGRDSIAAPQVPSG